MLIDYIKKHYSDEEILKYCNFVTFFAKIEIEGFAILTGSAPDKFLPPLNCKNSIMKVYEQLHNLLQQRVEWCHCHNFSRGRVIKNLLGGGGGGQAQEN